MLGRIMPVTLPVEEDEMRLVQSRQNKLARDIDIINQKIRNNVLSAAEGSKRIMFKKAEIDQLEYYKRSRRTPTGRLSPPPRTSKPVKSSKPANKYNPYATDKVPGSTKPADFGLDTPQYKRSSRYRGPLPKIPGQSFVEDDRAGMTSKSEQRPSQQLPPAPKKDPSLNRRGLREADYFNRIIENYKNGYYNRIGRDPSISGGQVRAYKNTARSMWSANRTLPTLVTRKKAKNDYKVSKRDPSLNTRGLREEDYFNRITENYKNLYFNELGRNPSMPSEQVQAYKNAAKSMWSANETLPTLVTRNQKTTQKTTQKSTMVVSQNPHGKNYGTSLNIFERKTVGSSFKKYGKYYYGPKSKSKRTAWRKWNKENNIAGLAGGIPPAVRRRARLNRQQTMMRRRVGAQIDFSEPAVNKVTTMRSWETYGRPEEVDVIKSFVPMMIGLEKFPELTPEGNAMMVEVMQTNHDPQKMQVVANKLATDLVNKSGYFVKKYNVEVDPLQKKVKVSEMSGLAGGLPKTRNSMQRLLK